MYGLGLQEWHVPTFSFLFFSQKGLDELMVMHRHVAGKLDTQIFADWERCFGRILTYIPIACTVLVIAAMAFL